ncbi:MAG TPA: sulfatase [bacterium]|nr:sulfatase [bacterium]
MKTSSAKILLFATAVALIALVFNIFIGRHERLIVSETNAAVDINTRIETEFHAVSGLLGDWLDFKSDSLNTYNKLKSARENYDAMTEAAEAFAPETATGKKLGKILKSKVYHLRNLNLSISECCRSILWGPLGDKGMACNSSTGKMIGNRFQKRSDEFDKIVSSVSNGSIVETARDMITKETKPGSQTDDKKNILFILIDTLRADHLGAGGYDKNNSPFMDRLASEGIWFSRCYSQAPTTIISVPSILTGVYPFTHNLFPDKKWDFRKLLTPVLRDAGYSTAGISANSLISAANNFDYGFEYFEAYNWSDSRLLNNNVLNYLQTYRDESKPYFMYVHYVDPHATYFSPDDFNEKRQKPARARVDGFPLRLRNEFTDRGKRLADYLTDEDVDYLKEIYDGEIRFIDRHLESLFGELREKGLLENTIVALTSDHGEAFLEHEFLIHSRSMHEELIHVPLILWGAVEPGAKPGTRIDYPVETVDILPTLMEWNGVPVPDYVQGGNLMKNSPFTDGVPAFSITSMGWSFETLTENNIQIAAIDQKTKAILHQTENRTEFYSLDTDPGEKNNLAGTGDGEEERLLNAIRNWTAKTRAASGFTGTGEKNPALMKQLKELGYVK